MGQDSKIEWCDHTFNPWIGCTKVSAGCSNCYAEHLMDKRYGRVQWGPQGKRVRTSKANWQKPLKWNAWAASKGVRYKVFCASLADVFEVKADQKSEMDAWRADLWHLIEVTPHLDWLLLTKRPEQVLNMVPPEWWVQSDRWTNYQGWPKNAWVGTSVENQEQADQRIHHLLAIPTPRRFLSIEPLLGAIDIWKAVIDAEFLDDVQANIQVAWGGQWLHWVIAGGESGHNARPMHPDWVRSIRDQCAGVVPFFFKQWGEWVPAGQSKDNSLKVGDTLQRHLFGHAEEGPVLMHKMGKKRAGRRLDGVEHNEIPESVIVTTREYYG